MEMVDETLCWYGTLPEVPKVIRSRSLRRDFDTMASASFNASTTEAGAHTDFGRPGNYSNSQVERLAKHIRGARPMICPSGKADMSGCAAAHCRNRPPHRLPWRLSIDNLIYAPDAPRVLAVLDWELATIGDPLSDFHLSPQRPGAMPRDGDPLSSRSRSSRFTNAG